MECNLSEKILQELKEEINSGASHELSLVWEELWDEEERDKRKKILAAECRKEIREFLNEVLVKEKEARDQYINRVEDLLNEIHELQSSLEIPIPYEDVENLPLHIMAARLNKKAEKYRVIRQERIQKLKDLSEKEAVLCEKLGTLRQVTDTSEIPTLAKLKYLEDHIAAMEQEKMNRTVTFLELKQAIAKLYKDLGIEPLLIFEKQIVSEETVENFPLTNENMAKVDDLRKKLKAQLEEAKEQIKELTEKLFLLWNYIEEPEDHQQEFLSNLQGYTVQAINALKQEISRCEAKKKENISVTLERIRKILVEEWDRCLYGKDEREKFRLFKTNCYTEDLCDLHELEIKKLRTFYQNNEKIFVLLQKHEKLFNKLLELEKGSKNANRYYNRGGQLLQEEKERRIITKELPVVEEELRALLKKYEEEHKEPFTAFGAPVELVLDEQWNTHFGANAMEKLFRKKAPRTPLMKRECLTPSAEASASKVPRLAPSQTKHVTPKTVNLRTRKAANPPRRALVCEPTYEDFQNSLQKKVEGSTKENKFRSTAVNELTPGPFGILRERNTPNNIGPITPVQSSPGKAFTPMCSPFPMKSPRTVPRTRRMSQKLKLTPARARLPLII